MMDWVSWPLGKNIDKWIVALLKGLAAVRKFSILIEVSLAKIEKVGGSCPARACCLSCWCDLG
jgi:ubiquitin carboxyl-terminal hydrolase 35/38